MIARSAPVPTVRELDYGLLAVSMTREPPPQADWMLMVALRESESWLTSPEGLNEAGIFALASRELAEFYESTGFYVDVTLRIAVPTTSPPVSDEKQSTLWMRTPAADIGRMGPVLMQTLTTPILFDAANDFVGYSYWSEGRDIGVSMTTAEFAAAFMGTTVATLG